MSPVLAQVQPRMLTLLLGAILLLSATGAYLYLFKNDLSKLHQLNRTYHQSARVVNTQQQALSEVDLAQLGKQVDELNSRLYGKRTNMGPGQMVSYIIGELDVVAKRNGVRLIGVKPGARTELLGFDEVPFDVEVTGQYFDLYNWLQDAESELRPMVVKRFHLAPAQPSDAIRMQLRVVSYRPPEGS